MSLTCPLVLLSCCSQQKQEDTAEYPMLEYSDIASLKIQLPYIYTCGDRKQLLVYGSNHTADPKDPQVADIEHRITSFKPDLILYEGDGITTGKTKSATVSEFFEMGLVMYLADSLGIPTMNIEPPAKDKYAYLLEKYPKQEVLLAILGLQITMMQAANEDLKSKYPVMIRSLLDEGFPLNAEEQSPGYFYKIYSDYFKSAFSYDNFDSRNIQAKYNTTSLNKINQDANRYRDRHIIRLIEKELGRRNRIYLQIGGWHAIVCEPAFRKITSSRSNVAYN